MAWLRNEKNRKIEKLRIEQGERDLCNVQVDEEEERRCNPGSGGLCVTVRKGNGKNGRGAGWNMKKNIRARACMYMYEERERKL
ncbi:hypothetical protein WN51_10836 [Melipona quadrifasciata]|uniref:Uncharacterized protein n=1 Tax=Melipona quadrifasciata TaxID=166423 RepID=A0A0M9A4S3_9HYME|nr:hypothetical protein WN51_10836 [Melipona quadrifasciata]